MENKKLTPFQILRKRFPSGEYALLKEVSDAAGMHRSRSADFIIISLWPSRGLGIHGIELKSFRSDWLNERKSPAKAENIFQYCDHFSLLTSGEKIATMEEIPETWGWMEIKGNRIHILKPAPKLSPAPISRHFLAAMMKRATDLSGFIHTDEIEERIKQSGDNAIKNQKRIQENLEKSNEELMKIILLFESESGLRMDPRSWSGMDPKEVGKAVKFIIDGGHEEIERRLKDMKDTARRINEDIERGLGLMKNQNQINQQAGL